MLEGVFYHGDATWSEDQLLLLERNAYPEECYFTFSYSPIRDESGGIGGIFTAVTETTSRVLGERRLRTLRELSERAVEAQTAAEACTLAATTLASNLADLPFALIYLLDEKGQQAQLAGATHLAAGTLLSPQSVDLQSEQVTNAAWPLAQAVRTGRNVQVTDLAARFTTLPIDAWGATPHKALVLPIAAQNSERPAGLFIAATSPRRALDDDYVGFFTLIAGHIAAAVANARAYDEPSNGPKP